MFIALANIMYKYVHKNKKYQTKYGENAKHSHASEARKFRKIIFMPSKSEAGNFL